MGQKHSNRRKENALFHAVASGELEVVEAMMEKYPFLLKHTTGLDKLSLLHVAAVNGQIQVLSMLLDKTLNIDKLNCHKQTPLMLAVMHGRTDCVEKLIDAGANMLVFDFIHQGTCLHYAAYYGQINCLKAILSVAHTTRVVAHWGFAIARFVNVRDGKGATPLHIAALHRNSECLHALLEHGALVCARTGLQIDLSNTSSNCGSTPLHMAAAGGSLDCVRILLAWGADRLQLDDYGNTPFAIALQHKHKACAALLNPSSAALLVWPYPLKFIRELDREAKALLEKALVEVNREREKIILNKAKLLPSKSEDDITALEASNVELCCICCDQVCTIEVRPCGHQMCTHCTLRLCQIKTDHSIVCPSVPVCPSCRGPILKLLVTKTSYQEQ